MLLLTLSRNLFTSMKEIEKLKMEIIAMISSWMLQGELQCDHHKSSLIFLKVGVMDVSFTKMF
jgi:hypothetical protein